MKKINSIMIFACMFTLSLMTSCTNEIETESCNDESMVSQLKATTAYPYCSNSSFDSDGDGWGWENSQTCIVKGSAADPSASTDDSYCSSSKFDPDGDGWGWENNKSCVVKGSVADENGSKKCPSGSLNCPSGMRCGCEVVEGLGKNKIKLKNAGASQYFLGSAMLETRKMDTNYTYGDGKSGDSFNAGRCKVNWFAAKKAGVGQGSTSAFWDKCKSEAGDVAVWSKIKNSLGNKYWAVHRNGETGFNNPNTNDINNFKKGNDWSSNKVADHQYDNLRFWIDIPAI